MKRAIFKLGSLIVIESTTAKSYFKVTIDVEKWQKQTTNNWSFSFDELDEVSTHPKKNWGTKIHVTKLTKDASEQFDDKKFIVELRN